MVFLHYGTIMVTFMAFDQIFAPHCIGTLLRTYRLDYGRTAETTTNTTQDAKKITDSATNEAATPV